MPDLDAKVPDPKLEVPDLRSGGIRLNLTPDSAYYNVTRLTDGHILQRLGMRFFTSLVLANVVSMLFLQLCVSN